MFHSPPSPCLECQVGGGFPECQASDGEHKYTIQMIGIQFALHKIMYIV